MRKLPSLLLVFVASCASAVPSSDPDASDRGTHDATIDTLPVFDGDTSEGSVSPLDAALDASLSLDSPLDTPDAEALDAVPAEATDIVTVPPDAGDAPRDGSPSRDSGDGGRECETWNANYTCADLFGVDLLVDPGARFACCNGRCVIGGCCVNRPDCDGWRGGCGGGPCDPWAGNVCCFQRATQIAQCVPRNSGYCERRQ